MKGWKKGGLIGLIIMFILILIPSYFAPIHNYNSRKMQYEEYNTVIQNCGSNPSNDCLKNLCAGKHPGGFCEAVNQEYNPNLPAKFYDWRSFTRTEKPNILVLLTPNIKDGLETFLMFGPFGLLILMSPIVIGIIIGLIIQRSRE